MRPSWVQILLIIFLYFPLDLPEQILSLFRETLINVHYVVHILQVESCTVDTFAFAIAGKFHYQVPGS